MLVAAPVTHAAIMEVGFQVNIASKEAVLENPNDSAVRMFAAWDSPYQRIADRNMPFVEVRNLGGSTANLTEFRMTIGDTNFNFSNEFFGSFALLGDSTAGVDLSGAITSSGDELVVTLGNGGLAPGEVVRFRIDLAVDAGVSGMFPHPDFRTVLFDMNDMDGNGISDNASVSALFTDPDDSSMTLVATSELIDFSVNGPQAQYFNQFIRPYSVMEGIDTFSAQGLAQNSVVPEPSTAGLAVGGLMMAFAAVRRRRFRIGAA